MKKITNKETQLQSKDGFYDRFKLAIIICEAPAKDKSLTFAEMLKRQRIIDALSKSNQEFAELEDADFSLLKSLFENFDFAKVSTDIIEFGNHLEEVSKESNDK